MLDPASCSKTRAGGKISRDSLIVGSRCDLGIVASPSASDPETTFIDDRNATARIASGNTPQTVWDYEVDGQWELSWRNAAQSNPQREPTPSLLVT